eukprot:1905861-Rhodomonas_salina.2
MPGIAFSCVIAMADTETHSRLTRSPPTSSPAAVARSASAPPCALLGCSRRITMRDASAVQH